MTANLTIETFPNEAAADYIRGKAVADPTHFGNLPPQLKQRAFTVAGIEQLDALRRMRDIIAKLPEGANWDEAKRDLAAEISPFIDVDAGGDARHPDRLKAGKARAEFLLRTHGFQAYAVARHQEQMETIDVFPYWKYVTVGDSRVRAAHAALDGKVLRADDPWWQTHYPPWDWGCRCIVEQLDEEDAMAAGVTDGKQMPMPQRSESFAFDPTNAGIDLEKYRKDARFEDDADWRLKFVTPAKNVTVQTDDGGTMSMWDLCLKTQTARVSSNIAGMSRTDSVEYFSVISRKTGVTEATIQGTAEKVDFNVDKLKHGDYITIHTHLEGGNIPSAADMATYRTRFDGEDANTPSWDYVVAVPKAAGIVPRARLIVTKGRIPDTDMKVLEQINRRLAAAKESDRMAILKEYTDKLDELESKGLIEYKETKGV